MLDDLLRKTHFHGFYSCHMTAIIKWTSPCAKLSRNILPPPPPPPRPNTHKQNVSLSPILTSPPYIGKILASLRNFGCFEGDPPPPLAERGTPCEINFH